MDFLRDPQYKTPDGAALRIWRDAAPNRFLTEQLGRAVFDDVIYCEVITPGSRDSTPVFELERVFDENMQHPEPKRGPKYEELKQYVEDFKKSEATDTSLAGTPLAEWPEMNRSLVASLKAQGVYTVDALAALPDSKLNVVGPDGRSWREKAKAYIENAKDGAYATGLAARIEVLEVELQASRDREAELAAKLTAAEKPPAKPAKAEPDAREAAIAEIGAAQTAPVNGAPQAVAGEGETLVAATAPAKVATPAPII